VAKGSYGIMKSSPSEYTYIQLAGGICFVIPFSFAKGPCFGHSIYYSRCPDCLFKVTRNANVNFSLFSELFGQQGRRYRTRHHTCHRLSPPWDHHRSLGLSLVLCQHRMLAHALRPVAV